MSIRLHKVASRQQNSRFFLLLIVLFGLAPVFFNPGESKAEQVTLAWDPNTEADLAGYRIHLGTASEAYNTVIDVGNQTNFTVTNLNRGTTYFFSVTAYNTQGYESDYSNEVNKAVVRQYQLVVGKRGTGLGTIFGEGIDCGADCQGVYDEGSQVTLNVNLAAGSIFTGWSGDDCSGLGECILSMWSDKSLSAGLLDNAEGVVRKNRTTQVATAPAGRSGRNETVTSGKRSKENQTAALAGGSAVAYYVITRRTDRRGTTSGYESLVPGEVALRSKYTPQ